jgi:hypothetical protein
MTGGDIEEDQLVRSLCLVPPSHLYRVAGVPQVDEVRPFDDPAGVDIEAGDNAFGEHGWDVSETAEKGSWDR